MADMDLATLLSTNSSPRAFHGLSLSSDLKVLVLAPHPDDFDVIAVTMKQFLDNGNAIHVAVARAGSGVDDDYRAGLTFTQKADLCEKEQRKSLRLFGLPESCITFISLSNDAKAEQSLDSPENAATIFAIVEREAPDIVFLPHGNDTNKRHRAVYSLFNKAARRLEKPLAAFLIRDPKTIEMRIDIYTPFGQEEADWKGRLLRCHDSQQQRNLRTRGYGFDERILNVNRGIASDLSLAHEYAEAFEVELYNYQSNSQ